jgi:hypothetical protein
LTDSPFTEKDRATAREILAPFTENDEQLDGIMKGVETGAVEFRQELVHTALAVRDLLKPPKPGRRTVVIAPSWTIANLYCLSVHATSDTHTVILDPDRVRGFGRGSRIVVVVAHDPHHRMSRFDDALRNTRAQVSYINIDMIMGVDRG